MKYKWSRDNSAHLLKVFGWTVGSAVVAAAISFLGKLEVAPQYLFLVSVVNTLLVAVKEWLNNKR